MTSKTVLSTGNRRLTCTFTFDVNDGNKDSIVRIPKLYGGRLYLSTFDLSVRQRDHFVLLAISVLRGATANCSASIAPSGHRCKSYRRSGSAACPLCRRQVFIYALHPHGLHFHHSAKATNTPLRSSQSRLLCLTKTARNLTARTAIVGNARSALTH
jgi:hypothetical protein